MLPYLRANSAYGDIEVFRGHTARGLTTKLLRLN